VDDARANQEPTNSNCELWWGTQRGVGGGLQDGGQRLQRCLVHGSRRAGAARKSALSKVAFFGVPPIKSRVNATIISGKGPRPVALIETYWENGRSVPTRVAFEMRSQGSERPISLSGRLGRLPRPRTLWSWSQETNSTPRSVVARTRMMCLPCHKEDNAPSTRVVGTEQEDHFPSPFLR